MKTAFPPRAAAQKRLWLISNSKEGNVAYNIAGTFMIRGDLDVGALGRSLDSLISRHEVLRTVFRTDASGDVLQYVLSPGELGFALSEEDYRGRPPGELEARVGSDFSGAFDLSTGPLLRGGLYRRSEREWVFSFVMHHIISDGWSMDILVRELMAYYRGHSEGSPVELPSLGVQYRDYAAWQQSELTGEVMSGHRSYWLERFSGSSL